MEIIEESRSLLGLAKVPKPDDTADALALAICHANTGTGKFAQILKGEK